MATPNAVRGALRANNIVGLLEHKPGPGIYSRLERAVQQLPENVRVQELPGLLKRYKDGIPGWELNAVDLNSVVAGRTVVPREELLAAVRERSPVFTNKNVILGGNATRSTMAYQPDPVTAKPVPIGGDGRHGKPVWEAYGLQGPEYKERLLLQPEDPQPATPGQWQDNRNRGRNHFVGNWLGGNVVSHLRTDTNGDALRIVELQSDLQNQAQRAADPNTVVFPTADVWQELQLKSALLDAARSGKNALEVANPEDISAVVGFPKDKSKKFYGTMVPQILEKTGKRLGGFSEISRPAAEAGQSQFVDDTVRYINSTHNQQRGEALENAVMDLAKMDDIHAAEMHLRENPSIIETANIPQEAKTELQRYLAYANQRATIWDNTGAEDYYSAMDVLSNPNWRHEYGFNGMDAVNVGRLRTELGLDVDEINPAFAGPLGHTETGLRNLDNGSEEILNNIQRKIVRELDGTDRTFFEVNSGDNADLITSQKLHGLLHNLQNTAETRAHVLNRGEHPRGFAAERNGPDLYRKLSEILGEERATKLLPEIMHDLEQYGEMRNNMGRLQDVQETLVGNAENALKPSGWRGVISDEMRRRIINEGIPAAVAIGVGTGLATGSNEAQAKPVLPESDAVLRAAMPWQTQRKINRLTKQVDTAYERGDFKTAEKLDAQREQLVEDWDNKLAGLDEGDGNVDFEPEPYDQESSWTDELANIYGRAAVAQSPTYGIGNDAELAQALRGVFPDTAQANAIPDSEIIQYAKDAFDQRQSHLDKVRSRSPEDGVRAMQTQMRGAGIAPAMAAGMPGQQSEDQSGGYKFDAIKAFNELPRGRVDLGPMGSGTPDRSFDFSMANSPGEWATYYDKAAKEGYSQEHLQFKKNVAEVMQQPLIRVGAANDRDVQGGTGLLVDGDPQDRITPAQFVNEYLDVFAGRMPPERRAQVVQRVQAKLDGSTRAPDELADPIVNRMMNSLQASSPGGKHAAVDPMPQEQLEQLKAQHGGWADSMLTPGGADNFQTLRGYELLRSTMEGEHAPVYADTMSNVVAGVKGIFDSKARQNFRDSTLEAGPEGRFIRGNRDYAASGPREGEPAAFRNQDGSSRFANTTTSNVQGLMRAGSDVSNPVGAMSWPLYESFSEFSRTPVGQAVTGEGGSALFNDYGWDAWRHMAAKRQAFDREQPILPAGMSREEFDRQQAAHQQDRAEGQAWGATTWPNVQNAFEQTGLMFSPQAWGGGDAPAPEPVKKTWGPPLYNDYGPNFLPNTVGNIPSAAIMASAAATGGISGLASGAFKPSGSTVRSLINSGMGLGKGAVRGAGAAVTSQAKDIPADFGTDMGIGGGIAGWANYRNYLLTPQEDNALLPDVDPNEMSIDELNQARTDAMNEREKRFRSNQWQWGRQ